MAVVTTKSLSITNLDATPIVANVIGEGAAGMLRAITDSVTSAAGDSTLSIYRLVRIPTNSKVKRVLVNSAITNAGAGDIDVAFSDSLTDGTQPSLTGIVQITGPKDNRLFGSASSLLNLSQSDKTFSGTFTAAHQNLPLWQVLVNLGATQFTADPGGFFDIVVNITTTVSNGGTVACEVDYVE